MTKWAMLLLAGYVALGVTRRLSQRQAGGAALALTVLVVAAAIVSYRATTPTDTYIRSVDATVYATGDPDQPGAPATTEDQAGATAATWLTTNHARALASPAGGGG